MAFGLQKWLIEQANKNAPHCGGVLFYSVVSLRFDGLGDHILEQDLERHRVPTAFVGQKEFTVALKDAVIIGDMVFIVIPVKGKIELVETEPFTVLRIAFCLLQLADQSVILGRSLLSDFEIKKTRGYIRVSLYTSLRVFKK